MIKAISSAVLVTILAISITGCTKTPDAKDGDCKQEGEQAPKWTCAPDVKNFYAGVGIAQESDAGMAHMRRVALDDGRSDLTQQITSQIKDKITIYNGTNGVGTNEIGDQNVETITKQLAKVDLVDSKAVESWNAPSGALYLLVTVPKKPTNKQIRKNLISSFKNEGAIWQQFKAKKALEGLEKDFSNY
jgi:hypothetical protein